MLTLKNDDAVNAKRRQIAEAETAIAEARSKYTAGTNAENETYMSLIKKLEGEWNDKSRELTKINSDIKSTQDAIESLSAKKADTLAKWHEANDRKWTGSDTCDAYGENRNAVVTTQEFSFGDKEFSARTKGVGP